MLPVMLFTAGLPILLTFGALAIVVFQEATLFAPAPVAGADAQLEKRQRSEQSSSEFLGWVRQWARRTVFWYSKYSRPAELAKNIALEVEGSTSLLLDRSAPSCRSDVGTRCTDRKHAPIGVTVPEVLAIANCLSTERPHGEVQVIAEHARQQMAVMEELTDEELSVADVPCPLLNSNGECLVHSVRPIACRKRCSYCCGGDGERLDSVLHDRLSAASGFAAAIGDSITAGMSEGLREAGLDAKYYELNDALCTALSVADSSARWAAGEGVFDNCRELKAI